MVNSADQTNEDKFVPMVYQLANAGIDVNGRDYKGRTALELAIMRELMDLMVALLRVGVDPNEHDYKAKIREFGSPFEYELINTLEKYEPGLWGAVNKKDASMVHMMVNSWCRINIKKGNKTLMQSVQDNGSSMEEIYNILDDYEVTIEFVHATLAGDEKRMLEFLMDSKPCDPYIMDISYQERWSRPLEPRSLRQTAIAMGHQHVLHLLPEDDDDLDTGQGQVHNHKVCSATVMGNTSMLDDDYVPSDKVSRTNGSIIGGDGDSVHYGNSWNFKNGKRVGIKKQFHVPKKKHTNADDYKAEEKNTEDTTEQKAGQYEECIVKLSGVEEKCFYFHEVDNFVAQCEPQTPKEGLKPHASMRGKTSDTAARDYSHNWEKVTIKQNKTKAKSKMCVIS